MKILLLNPPSSDDKHYIREGRCTQEQGIWATLWPPVSLAEIAAVLLQDGLKDVRILDCPSENIDMRGLKKPLLDFSPDVVLWSTGTPSIVSDLEFASLVKSWAPRAWTGVFGTHVTALDRQCLAQTPGLDGIIRNEPEYTVRDLIRALEKKHGLEDVLGLSYRTGETIQRNPDRPFIPDLDDLPFPAWELVNVDSYRLPLKGNRFLMIAPLRGCPFSCSFCTAPTYYGHKLRRRSPDKVIEEIKRNMKDFGVDHFFFWADTFVLDKAYVRELCEKILSNGLKIAWTSNSRADTVDAELLLLMAKAGCWMLSFGIESSSQEILDRNEKRLRVEQVAQAVGWTKAAGIQVAGHFILGLPGETRETMAATARFAKELDVDFAQFYCAVPYPGAPLYEEARREGWIKSDDFSQFKQEKSVLAAGVLSPQEIMAARDRAHREFYFRPRAVIAALKNAKLTDISWIATCLRRFVSDHL